MNRICFILVAGLFLCFHPATFGQEKLESQVVEALLRQGNHFIPSYKISKRKGRIKTFNRFKQPEFVLLSVSKSPLKEAEFDTTVLFEKEVLKARDRFLLQDFCRKNRLGSAIHVEKKKGLSFTYLPSKEYKKLFGSKSDWHSYYKKFGLKPMVCLSRPGFNAKQNRALIYLTYSLGENDAAGYFLVMKKSWGSWKPDGNMLLWMK